jgi:hypothetical protein
VVNRESKRDAKMYIKGKVVGGCNVKRTVMLKINIEE